MFQFSVKLKLLCNLKHLVLCAWKIIPVKVC